MNPAQMLKVVKMAKPAPKTDFLPLDYAGGAGLTAYACVQERRCPVCGSKGGMELYLGTDQTLFFYCDTVVNHVFEVDDDAKTADRVDMGG